MKAAQLKARSAVSLQVESKILLCRPQVLPALARAFLQLI